MTSKDRISGLLVTFLILFGFWLLLSWHFDPLHLVLGLICSLLVAYLSHDLLIGKEKISFSLRKIILFIFYLFYLAYNIVLANLDVAYRVLHPKMPINPEIVRFNSKLNSDIAKTILANSITLTPGTITIDVRDGTLYVHSLSPNALDNLLKGEMENKLVRIFKA